MSVLSVVLPAYNEELMIEKTCSVLREVLTKAGISYELVLVNDGSADRTWEEIEKAGKKTPIFWGWDFPETLEKRLRYLPGLPRQKETP